ncbi:MAG: hypothetical protein LUC45_03915 [Paraprevotella sp.]|nr:hypothetical protein [Paraprevotella sp.]
MAGLPVGRYVFRAASQKGATGGAIELFANSQTSPVNSVKTLRIGRVEADVLVGLLAVGVKSDAKNACQWVSLADVKLEYQSPVILLEEALTASDTLTYGTDREGALQKAADEARALESGEEPGKCMAALQTLEEAMMQYRLDNASPLHPVDLTARMKNAGFDLDNTTGWTLTVADAAYPRFNQGVAEFWHTTFDISQTLSNLPSGNYRVSMQARSDAGVSNKNFRMYVRATGDAQVSVFCADKTRADGTDQTQHLGQNAEELNADASLSRIRTDVFVGDGRLTVGALCDNADMWCVMNDFVVEYLGLNADDLWQSWPAQVAEAKAMDRDSLPQAVGTLLDRAVQVDVSSVDADSLSRALSVLMNEVENARSTMVAYKQYSDMKKTLEEIASNSVPKLTSSLTILKNAITSAEKNAEAAVNSAAVLKVYNDLESARQTYVVDAEPTNGLGFDMTFKVANAACTAAGSWMNDGCVNFRTLLNEAQNGEYEGGAFFENWIGPGNELKSGQRPIYQTVSALPNGN